MTMEELVTKLYKRKLRLKDRKKGFFFDSREIREKLPDEVKKSKTGKKLKTFDCSNCPLDKGTKHVPGFGDPESNVWWLGRDPGRTEVSRGRPFVGRAGKLLDRITSSADFRADHYYIDNIVSCRPPGDTFNKTSAKCCYKELEDKLIQYKPKLIITLGKEATERILGFCDSMEAFNAIPVPSHKYGCVVYPLYHPSYISRIGSSMLENDYYRWIRMARDLNLAFRADGTFLTNFLKENSLNYKTREIKSIEQFKRVAGLIRKAKEFSIDFENNTSKVYTEGSELFVGSLATWVSIGKKKKYKVPFGYWWKHSDYYGYWDESERSEIEDILIDLCTDPKLMKIINNSKHEDNCLRQHIGCEMADPVYCTMVNRHIINSRRKVTSLRTQALQAFGINYKFKTDPKLKPAKGQKFNRIKEIPIEELGERCSVDTAATLVLREKQEKAVVDPTTHKSENVTINFCIPFYAKGIKTFTNYEQRGINVDMDLLQELKEKWGGRIRDIDVRIGKMPTVKRFVKAHTKPFNIKSTDQQRILLFGNDYFALQPMEGKVTAKKKVAQVDEEVLTFLAEEQDSLLAKLLIERNKLHKLVHTYLLNIELYIGADGRLHPDFWLHTTRSFRSSSSKPNFQNFPMHYEIGEDLDASEIRAVFIPSHPDWELRSVDYGGNEVKGLWMLCRDTQLVIDINEGLDMHRYWASKLYEKLEDEVTSDERYEAKNKFVFRTFYGGSAEAAAKDMDLSPFLVENCQRELFDRYPRIKAWQDRVLRDYEDDGYVELLTGFKSEGPMEREAAINRAIQGTSFHKLLHSCNEVEDLQGFDTMAIAQIHDDILFDGPKSERDKHTEAVSNIMCNLPWEWSKGVMEEVEWKKGPNWRDMKGYKVISQRNQ
jgi:uracil-DNA glycosylase family 4